MKKRISLLIPFLFSTTVANTIPKYPAVCEEMAALAREIANMNSAMVEQMKGIEQLEKKQRQDWKMASIKERSQIEKFCRDSKNNLLSIKNAMSAIFKKEKY